MSKLDDILDTFMHQQYYDKKQVKDMFKSMAEAWRDEEYIPIDEFIAEIDQL